MVALAHALVVELDAVHGHFGGGHGGAAREEPDPQSVQPGGFGGPLSK